MLLAAAASFRFFLVVWFVRTYVFVLRCNPCFCGVLLSVYASLRLRLPMCADHSMNFTFCLLYVVF